MVLFSCHATSTFHGTYIYKSDSASSTPYNLYIHTGLSPGPIAGPRLRPHRRSLAIDAKGFLQFSATLAEHMKAVGAVRKSNRHLSKLVDAHTPQ